MQGLDGGHQSRCGAHRNDQLRHITSQRGVQHVTPDASTISSFLADYVQNAIHLVSIHPDRSDDLPRGQWFGTDIAGATAWALACNMDGLNVYWTVNEADPACGTKPSKAQIRSVRFAHSDIDPPRSGPWDKPAALVALQTRGAPSFVIDSGNGLQPLWRLSEPTTIEQIEAVNRGIAAALGGDHCWNVDRLLRVPGTINYPTLKKRTAGRTPQMATLAQVDTTARYQPTALVTAFPDVPRQKAPSGVTVDRYDLLTATDLPDCTARLRDLIDHPAGEDRSKDCVYVAIEMGRCGYTDEQIVGVLMNPANAVHDHIGRQHDPERAARRAAAYAATERPDAVLGSTRPASPVVEAPTVVATAPSGEVFSNGWDGVFNKNNHLCCGYFIFGVARGRPRLNEFTGNIEMPDGTPINDHIDRYLWLECRAVTKLEFPENIFRAALWDMAYRAKYHPVRDYLAERQTAWDGVARIDRWMPQYLGAPDTEFTRAVGAIFLMAAVRRVRQPGCKFDEIVVLEGQQGGEKSSACEALCPDPRWFTDALHLSMSTKEIMETVGGKWIIEAPEMASNKDTEHVKAMLSRKTDKARMAYGKYTTEAGRQFVAFGSTNKERYLFDATGNRRFWPVPAPRVDLAGLVAIRDQLWAEAAVREAAGESIRLPRHLWAVAGEEQAERMVSDPFADVLARKLGSLEGRIDPEMVWSLLGVPVERRPAHMLRMGDAMKRNGWTYKRFGIGGQKPYRYWRGRDDRDITSEEIQAVATGATGVIVPFPRPAAAE